MPDPIRSVIRRAVAVACFAFSLTSAAAAQDRVSTPPAAHEFFPRYAFHLTGARLASSDDRFSWDTHWGGELDMLDYVAGRVTVLADYQAVLGSQFQPFDPYQGNYTLAAAGSARLGNHEVLGVFQHVSRHLSDRPKVVGVAMNAVLGRVLRRDDVLGLVIDSSVELGRVVARSYVDYTWLTEVDITIRRPVAPQTDLFVRAHGDTYAVDEAIAGRGRQNGGRVEAGVRLAGKAATFELIGGYEQVIDADPLERGAQRWAFAGFRVLNE